MIQRILAWLGFSWYIPPPSFGSAGSPSSAYQVDGQTEFTYRPGQKAAPSQAEMEDAQDERRQKITDQDLVWPGKRETIYIRNEEPIAQRYQLSITDLPPAFYEIGPPTGGRVHPDGGVLLQPNEEASFEVIFQAAPPSQKSRPRTFNFVVTSYDPRRTDQAGDILDDMSMRWVDLPGPKDLVLSAKPTQITMRPWRRTALFKLNLQNTSYLPPSVQVDLVRGLNRDALASNPEKTGRLHQALPSRTSGSWDCLLPPSGYRNDYFISVAGKATVADKEQRLELAEPIRVRYIPWLRIPKDWLFLFLGIFFLVWLIFGIPIPQSPVVRMKLAWPDNQTHALEDLKDGSSLKIAGESGDPIHPTVDEGMLVFRLPRGWYGNRWPFGWTHNDPIKFSVRLVPVDANKAVYDSYNLDIVRSQSGSSDFKLEPSRGIFTGWQKEMTAVVGFKKGVRLNFYVEDLGAAKGKADKVEVKLTLGGEELPTPLSFPIRPGSTVLRENYDLPKQVGSPMLLEVKAATAPYTLTTTAHETVIASDKSFDIHLKFTSRAQTAAIDIQGPGQNFYLTITDLKSNQPVKVDGVTISKKEWSGGSGRVELDVVEEGMKVFVDGETADGFHLQGGGTRTLSTDPSKAPAPVVFQPPPQAPAPVPPAGTAPPAGGQPGATPNPQS